jgi:hypothetical protein
MGSWCLVIIIESSRLPGSGTALCIHADDEGYGEGTISSASVYHIGALDAPRGG